MSSSKQTKKQGGATHWLCCTAQPLHVPLPTTAAAPSSVWRLLHQLPLPRPLQRPTYAACASPSPRPPLLPAQALHPSTAVIEPPVQQPRTFFRYFLVRYLRYRLLMGISEVTVILVLSRTTLTLSPSTPAAAEEHAEAGAGGVQSRHTGLGTAAV